MKAPKSHTISTAGQHEVCAQFSRIEWGAVPNAYEDFGIDVLVHARDIRGNDKGLIVGVQVKTGKSYFREVVAGTESPKGWIYRERNREHLDYWLDHAVPQLVVLHDPSSKESYWAHVTALAITRTPKGWKILVPSQNRIDADNAAALLDVAATGRAAVSFEGSIWYRGTLDISPSREWRHSLIAPRLIAPHPNAGTSLRLSPVPAVGLLVERRVFDYQRLAELHPEVPSLTEAEHSPIWGWRFVWSVHKYFEDLSQPSLDRIEDAPDSSARAAATVVAMCALSAADNQGQAAALAAKILEETADLTPADQAWITVQRARALVQLGAVEDARSLAMEAQRLVNGEPPDVTVSAIAGAASSLLWSTAAWTAADVGDVVWRSDTAVSWWRDSTTSGGLGTFLDNSFKGWAESGSFEFSNRDSVAADLLTAIATADFSAEYGSFHADRQLLARYYLMVSGSESLQRRAIDWLRQSGDRSSLELIVSRYLGEGPVAPVKTVADAIGSNSWTYSALAGNLSVWQTAGDVMSPERAEAAFAVSLEAVLTGAFPITRSDHPTANIRFEALGCLVGLATATSMETHADLLQRLSQLVGGETLQDVAIATKLDTLLDWVDWSESDAETRERWLSAASSEQASRWKPSATILAALAESDERARHQLAELAKSGDWSALHKLRDVQVLSQEAASSLTLTLEQGVNRIVQNARGGSHGIGGWSLPPMLVWLNQCVPAVARWEGVIDLLNEASVSTREKAEACTQLAVNIDSISDDVRARLFDIASNPINATPDWLGGDSDMPSAAFLLRISLGVIEGSDRLRRLPELIVAGDSRSRTNAAEILGFVRDLSEFEVGVLATLTRDPSLHVRKQAVQAISRQIARGLRHPAALESLEVALRSEAVEIPYQGLAGLSRKSDSLPDELIETINHLSEIHVSGKVRRLARRIVIAYSE